MLHSQGLENKLVCNRQAGDEPANRVPHLKCYKQLLKLTVGVFRIAHYVLRSSPDLLYHLNKLMMSVSCRFDGQIKCADLRNICE